MHDNRSIFCLLQGCTCKMASLNVLKSTYLVFNTRLFLFLTRFCQFYMNSGESKCYVSSYDRGLILHFLKNLMVVLSISAHIQDMFDLYIKPCQ